MGTDCTVVIERRDDLGWEPIGLLPLPRKYELFTEMRECGCAGYPSDIDGLSKSILDTHEDWGEGYMNYQEWIKLLKKHRCRYFNVIKKKYYDDCRVIYRFDC